MTDRHPHSASFARRPHPAGHTRPAAEPRSARGASTSAFATMLLAALLLAPALVRGSQQQAAVPPPTGSAGGYTAQPTPPQYTGERITLNLKDADIGDFFRLIHEISGLNIVVDPNVKGTVTIALADVPWDQALDIVLRNNGLGKQVEGNVVRIATIKTLDDEAQAVADLRRAQEAAAPLETVYRTLNYAKASDVAQLLNQSKPSGGASGASSNTAGNPDVAAIAGYGLLCGRCQVTADARTNTLLIQAPPDFLPQLDAVLDKLDRKTPQIEIDARIVSTSETYSRDIGVQLGIAAGNSTTAVGGNPALGNSSISTTGLSPNYNTVGGSIPLSVNLPATTPTSGLGFITATNSYRIDAVLSAAETRGDGKIISRPQVITQNNAAAVVQQGVKIPVQTTIDNTISVQFFNVTLRLSVTPQITADGNVFLTVDIVNDQIDSGIPYIEGVPAIDTEQTTTNVLVGDGATVVIGGVMVDNTQFTVNEVPLLGDLPLLGNLFKEQLKSDSKQELLFFITPKILSS